MKNNEPKDKYCCYCGTKLIHKEIHLRFDESTGEPVYRNSWKCPKYRWFMSAHAKFNDYTSYDWI